MKAKQKTMLAKLSAASACAASLACAFPALALADDEEEGSEGISVLIPDMNEFIPMLIVFIVLCVVLVKWGWPVIERTITKRENTVKEALKKSEEAQIESERVLNEYKEQLDEAKAQSAQIIAEARETGEAVKADITSKAQDEANEMIAKAKEAIEAEKKQAIADLQASVADTSVDVAARLIGENLTDDEHRAIIERYVKEAGSLNAN